MTPSKSFDTFSETALSSHDQVARTLGVEIIDGTYPPGSKIPNEADILARFAISRTVLREVLKTLTAKGLIVSKTRVGTKVLDPTRWNLFDADVLSWKISQGLDEAFHRDLTEIRLAIEPRAAALSALRRTPEAVAELRDAVAAMRVATSTRRQFAEADLAFHQAIGAASGNVLMRSISAVIETALVASFTMSSPIDDPVLHDHNVRSHERIVDAIEAGDEDGAAEAMRAVIKTLAYWRDLRDL
ncbi:FadR/GntR family transcriptional regulator [Sphingomonas montana]|uniref:FadR/GntR family transcriptional regulator n=1 Tax=Sphingomonas montana TaxID=1843236 RepID=UPI00096EBDB8|nr:FadR/GntR family transcriptional regulator [Sphingomonas montana]